MDRLAAKLPTLVDPSDPLLDLGELRDSDGGTPIAGDPVRLAFVLGAGGGLELDAAPGRLAALRRVRAEGEHVLWLALGMFVYGARCAPLILWPVEFASDGRLVHARGTAPRVNDVLVAQLATTGIELPLAGDNGPLDLAAVLERAAAVADAHGWRVEYAACVVVLSFARFDIARDATRLPAAHFGPSGSTLAEVRGPKSEAYFDLLAPLEADASQLSVVAAAAAGATFVVQGAPGTGKSQTIANLVAHCASSGKTVLVVSDRTTALDVIERRLVASGIAEFCLPIYGEHASSAHALPRLRRVLDRAFRPAPGVSATGRAEALAASLDLHRTAMHAPTSLGGSVHDVLARLVELRTTPRAPLAERDATMLDRASFDRRLAAVRELASAANSVEPVATNVWRAAAPVDADLGRRERVARALDEAKTATAELTTALAWFATLVPGCLTRTPDQLRALGSLAELAAASPRAGAELLTVARGSRADDVGERVGLIRARGGGAIEPPRDAATFLAIALRRRALAAEVAESFADPDALAATELWTQLKRWTTSVGPLRYVALRAARAEVRRAAGAEALTTDEAMLRALEATLAERACRAALLAADGPARRWFGELAGEPLALDLDAIEAATAWGVELRRAFERLAIAGGEAGKHTAWRALVAQVAAGPDQTSLAPFAELAAAVARWDQALTEVAIATGIAGSALAGGDPHANHLATFAARVDELAGAVDGFTAWAQFHRARHAAMVAGVGPAIEAIERGDLAPDDLGDAWQRATLLAWLDAELRATRVLAQFDGAAHNARVAAFGEADRATLAAARAHAVARLAARVPSPRASQDAELAALRAAASDRPLRELVAELPTLLPRLAPCVLATPAAVARELDPALGAFDVVVFDEAASLPVAHALGALARAKAAIVVGDPRQAALGAEHEDLMSAALAAGWPAIELTTDYRSRHEDVFAFANRTYYRGRVELLPAAARAPELGIAWRRVAGVPDASGGNRAEADAIAHEIATALRACPTRTIAVAVACRAQEQLVHDALDAAITAEPSLAVALAQHAEAGEPLLVGTPDRLQGEERDLALVSLGGTAAELGVFALPTASRWLAIALTRARERSIIVSSFAPDDIAADAAPAARDLAELIAFARGAGDGGDARDAGDANLAPASDDHPEPASAITAAIGRALAERGWNVRHRVGRGASRVELAVVDPDQPDRFVLAIEHDGATYAGATSARDRDRLRAQRLAQLGWRVHRVWSLDWWNDAEREIQRAHGAIVAALAASRQRGASAPLARPRAMLARGSSPLPVGVAAAGGAEVDAAARHADDAIAAGSGPTDALAELSTKPTRVARGTIAIAPYVAAAIPAGRRAPDDMFAPRYNVELNKVVEQVLAAEAPMHVDLLARRVGAYFGVGRVTPRVADQVRVALAGRGRWGDEQGVVWRVDQDPTAVPSVRVAGATAAAKRDIAEVPLSELAAAARVVVERAHDVAASDLVRDCARLLGFARLTDRVSERVAAGVRLAVVRELISIDQDRATLPAS